MTIETVILTTIDEVDYHVGHCDEGRHDEHYEVRVTRKDRAATAQYDGLIVVSQRFATLPEALQSHAALTTVALLDRQVSRAVAEFDNQEAGFSEKVEVS